MAPMSLSRFAERSNFYGDSMFYSDGTSSNRTGFNRDGTSKYRIRNKTLNSGGISSYRIGNKTFFSNATTCTRIGKSTFCY